MCSAPSQLTIRAPYGADKNIPNSPSLKIACLMFVSEAIADLDIPPWGYMSKSTKKPFSV